MSRRDFWRIFLFFTKSSSFLVLFRLWGIVLDFWQKKSVWVVKTVFNCPRKAFRKNCFLKTSSLNFLLYFWTLDTKLLDFRRKLFNRFVKTAFYVSRGDFWLDCFLYENSWIFHRLWAVKRIFRNICAKASKGLSKLHFTCTKEFLGVFEFWRKESFYNFFVFWWITLRTFVKKISASFQKMHVRPLQRKFLVTIFFFFEKSSCISTEVERKLVWCSVQTFWQCGQNCFLRVQGRFLTNLIFSATFSSFSFVSGLWGKKLSGVWRKNFAGLSKVHFKRPDEIFAETVRLKTFWIV